MNRKRRLTGRLFVMLLSVGLLAAAMSSLGCGAEIAYSDVETESRSFTKAFPDVSGEDLRLSNLAGTVELVPGSGSEVVVETTVHARGRNDEETRRLLDEMEWEEGKDYKGRAVWTLTYPVERTRRFHYNGRGWASNSQGRYRGEKVKVSSRTRSGAPTLYADLRITYPGNGPLEVRNLVGAVRGGDLSGNLRVDTGSGKVDLGDFSGDLNVDTGSGEVVLGIVRGETLVDTGSGDIRIAELVGNGLLDTGSGNIFVRKVAMGRLEADTGSGDILIEDGTVSELTVDTGSGEIQVLGVDVVNLKADTGSGNVVLKTPLEEAETFAVDTGSGDVRIQASPRAAFDIRLNSGSGELLVRYDDAQLRKSSGEVIGATRGQGGARISVDTGSGDCVIGPA